MIQFLPSVIYSSSDPGTNSDEYSGEQIYTWDLKCRVILHLPSFFSSVK